jgi:hypothetical protein
MGIRATNRIMIVIRLVFQRELRINRPNFYAISFDEDYS